MARRDLWLAGQGGQFHLTTSLPNTRTFWHHPNKYCYNDPGWIPDPSEDFNTKTATPTLPPPGTGDPVGGSFGVAVTSRTTVVDGNTTTTTSNYSDGTTYIRSETLNDDGSTTVTQTFRDGSTSTVTYSSRRRARPLYGSQLRIAAGGIAAPWHRPSILA